MSLTPEQLEARRAYVGASDVAAICGENPYRNIIDVWHEKVHGLERDTESEAADIGNALEDACAVLASKALGVEVKRTDLFRTLDGTRLGVNLDGHCEIDGVTIPVECKTAGILHGWAEALSEWGDEWTDQVPAHYAIQVTAQMMVAGAPYGYVSAIIGNRGHVMYRIERDEALCSMILNLVESFWEAVESKTMPEMDGVTATTDVLARIRRVPQSVREFNASEREAVIHWQALRRQRIEIEKAEDAAKATVLAALVDSEAALLGWTGAEAEQLAAAMEIDDLTKAEQQVALTYLAQGRTDIDRDKLRAHYPEVWEACQRRSTYRVLRFGKAKAGMTVNVARTPAVVEQTGGAA